MTIKRMAGALVLLFLAVGANAFGDEVLTGFLTTGAALVAFDWERQ